MVSERLFQPRHSPGNDIASRRVTCRGRRSCGKFVSKFVRMCPVKSKFIQSFDQATWDPNQVIRARPWSSKLPGQRHRSVHRRPRKSSRIWDLGYIIGYTNSVLASSGLCNLRSLMASHSNYELKVDIGS